MDRPTRGLLPGLDPDQPIHRICSLWLFEEMLRLRQLVLVSPSKWEDPFEVLPERVQLIDERPTPVHTQFLERSLKPAFVQSWSKKEESDTLIRAYSRVVLDPHSRRNTCPRDEGVRVRSSARKLLNAMQGQECSGALAGVSFLLGSVNYASRDGIYQRLADLICQFGPETVGRGIHRAELLLIKRLAFSHEEEIRLICVDERPIPGNELLSVPCVLDEVLEEVTFDPRLSSFEREEREQRARQLGYSGQFGRSLLYQGTMLQIQFPNGWPGSNTVACPEDPIRG